MPETMIWSETAKGRKGVDAFPKDRNFKYFFGLQTFIGCANLKALKAIMSKVWEGVKNYKQATVKNKKKFKFFFLTNHNCLLYYNPTVFLFV